MDERPVRFEDLIERHHDELYRYAWRLLDGAGMVEPQDVIQEVFMNAYRAYPTLRAGSNTRAWLFRITTNCAYSMLRRSRRERASTISLDEEALRSPADPLERQVARRQVVESVQEAISLLPPRQQAAVLMRHIHGLRYDEIAAALECSEEAARASASEGVRRLRRELTGMEE
ncbi:MAG: RNA polymerase sigma factor [Anaerolineae bacterium]|nr:RNA polymerase sigma factor [Anaerolineae bacterium]